MKNITLSIILTIGIWALILIAFLPLSFALGYAYGNTPIYILFTLIFVVNPITLYYILQAFESNTTKQKRQKKK